MATVRLRPTFSIPLPVDRDAAIDHIRTRLDGDPRFHGRWRAKGRWAEIHLPHEARRMWSPHLSVRLDEDADGCVLFGRFAPDPEVWTLTAFLWIASAFFLVFGGVLGYVQWVSEESAWGVWLALAGALTLAAIHGGGALGQRLGQEQMVRLKGELDGIIEDLVEEESTERATETPTSL